MECGSIMIMPLHLYSNHLEPVAYLVLSLMYQYMNSGAGNLVCMVYCHCAGMCVGVCKIECVKY